MGLQGRTRPPPPTQACVHTPCVSFRSCALYISASKDFCHTILPGMLGSDSWMHPSSGRRGAEPQRLSSRARACDTPRTGHISMRAAARLRPPNPPELPSARERCHRNGRGRKAQRNDESKRANACVHTRAGVWDSTPHTPRPPTLRRARVRASAVSATHGEGSLLSLTDEALGAAPRPRASMRGTSPALPLEPLRLFTCRPPQRSAREGFTFLGFRSLGRLRAVARLRLAE